jgi:hypothetical protein
MSFRSPPGIEIRDDGVLIARTEVLDVRTGLVATETAEGVEAEATSGAGIAVVAATVAGLGAGSAGKMGLLRIGATPFRFLGVTYDATLAKWVSEEVSVWNSFNSVDANPGDWIEYTSPGPGGTKRTFGGFALAHRAYYEAGLRPQIRVVGTGYLSAAGDARIEVQSASASTSANGRTAQDVWLGSFWGSGVGTWRGVSSAFADFGPAAAFDVVLGQVEIYNDRALLSRFAGSVMLRWVSI